MALPMSRVLLLSSLLLAALSLSFLEPHPTMATEVDSIAPSPSPPSINCESACSYRCSKTWRVKMCNKMCMACCHKCGCVPDGPTAPRESCACYAQLKNPKGLNKCP